MADQRASVGLTTMRTTTVNWTKPFSKAFLLRVSDPHSSKKKIKYWNIRLESPIRIYSHIFQVERTISVSMAMMPDTEAWFHPNGKYSCTVVAGQTVLFLGGHMDGDQFNQISQLTPLGLVRIGTLPFEFYLGICLVMGRQLFLGFEFSNRRTCWSRLTILNSFICKIVILARIWSFSTEVKQNLTTIWANSWNTTTKYWWLEGPPIGGYQREGITGRQLRRLIYHNYHGRNILWVRWISQD